MRIWIYTKNKGIEKKIRVEGEEIYIDFQPLSKDRRRVKEVQHILPFGGLHLDWDPGGYVVGMEPIETAIAGEFIPRFDEMINQEMKEGTDKPS